MDRRAFLKASAFLTASTVSGKALSRDDDDERDGRRGLPQAGTYLFPTGVASGDPRALSVVLWTRVTPSGGGDDDIRVRLEVALDEDFRRPIWRERLTARAEWDYTLRHKLFGLLPNRHYYYRFVAGQDVSVTGRTRTAPLPWDRRATEVKFAFLSCQDWNANHWQTIDRLADEDVDFVVHLGDYIYEEVAPQTIPVESTHGEIVLPDGAPTPNAATTHAVTLADYRHLYRTYRSDPRLQKLHARHPMVVIWDDHEFSNDAWQDHQTYTNANVAELDRRRAATQAWFENMPADVPFSAGDPGFENIRLYRDFQFGPLVHLVMTDERLYRSDHVIPEPAAALATGADPVNGDSQIGSRYFVGTAALAGAEAQKIAAGLFPSILGTTQTEWWKQTMSSSRAAWRIWGNEVSLLRMAIDLTQLPIPPSPLKQKYVINADQWDGYNAARKDLMSFLRAKQIGNVVAVTGDIHAFFAGTVYEDHDVPQAQLVPAAVDLVTAGASSTPLFYAFKAAVDSSPTFAQLRDLVYRIEGGKLINTFDGTLQFFNPASLRHVDTNAIGYAVVRVTAEKLVAEFKKFRQTLPGGVVPEPVLESVTRVTVASGSAVPQVQVVCATPETCAV